MWISLRLRLFMLMASLLPSVSTAQLALPPGEPLPLPAPSSEDAVRTEDQISESLRRRAPFPDGQSSGDPILDDVLSVIRQRGSLVDGSMLDPALDPKSGLQTDGEVRNLSTVYQAAEGLLRAARILEGLGDLSYSRVQLIRGMRSEATKLLIGAVSRESLPQGMTP